MATIMTSTIAKRPPLPPPLPLPVLLGGGVPPDELPVEDFDGVGFGGVGVADAVLGDDAVLCAGEGELVAWADELGAAVPVDEGVAVVLAADEAALFAPAFPRRRER